MKTGAHPFVSKLKLFFKWGINFEEPYAVKKHGERTVQYADKNSIEAAILKKYPRKVQPTNVVGSALKREDDVFTRVAEKLKTVKGDDDK